MRLTPLMKVQVFGVFVFQTMYRGINIADAPPRREWMTVDECFDDVLKVLRSKQ